MTLFRQQGIRWRLALLYLSIFAVGLGVFCAVLFKYFQSTQEVAFDKSLHNFTVDISSNLEMDFVGRLFVVNSNVTEAQKYFPFHIPAGVMEIRDSRGRVLMRSKALRDRNLPMDVRTLTAIAHEKAILRTIKASDIGLPGKSQFRMLTYWTHHAEWREPLILQVAVPLDMLTAERRDLLIFFALAIPMFLVIAGFAGMWMSKYALVPVHNITQKARGITGVEKLKERIPVPEAHDEIRELAETFNDLLNRLDLAFASQDRFVSNASHQLKTPLTILKGELELLRKGQMSGPVLEEALDSASAEINRLIQLVQDLLLLARLEAGRDTISLTPSRLDEILMKAVARLQKLARNKRVQITTLFSAEDGESELDVEVLGDDDLIDSMIENFLENAIKYAPVDSIVDVSMKTTRDRVLVQIRDRGPGVPVELRQKVFERFARGEPSNPIPGSGLGLSIASEIARIHRVSIQLSEAESGDGTVVSLTFPRAHVAAPLLTV